MNVFAVMQEKGRQDAGRNKGKAELTLLFRLRHSTHSFP